MTLFEAARIKRNVDINIEDFDDIQKMIQNPFLLCDTLYIVCEDEATKCKISAEQFGKSLAGDAIKAARESLLMAISDFFEAPGKRIAFMEMTESLNEQGELTIKMIEENTEKMKESIRREGEANRKKIMAMLGNSTSGE